MPTISSQAAMAALVEGGFQGNPVDLAFCVGDLSYATGYLGKWETFMNAIGPVSSKVPYMVRSHVAIAKRRSGLDLCGLHTSNLANPLAVASRHTSLLLLSFSRDFVLVLQAGPRPCSRPCSVRCALSQCWSVSMGSPIRTPFRTLGRTPFRALGRPPFRTSGRPPFRTSGRPLVRSLVSTPVGTPVSPLARISIQSSILQLELQSELEATLLKSLNSR
jgi:hypothetical protein